MYEGDWCSLADFALKPSHWLGPGSAVVIWLFNWPRLSDTFTSRKDTMTAYWNAIGPPADCDGMWAENWFKMRRVCAVWQAGEIYAQMHNRFRAFVLLVPTFIIFAWMCGAPLIILGEQKQSGCVVVVVLYATILLALGAVRYLQAGVNRANELVRRAQRGDL